MGDERNDIRSDRDDSADKKAHGTHGRGGAEEKLESPRVTEPGSAKGSERGSAAWGSEGSGGSVHDKRSPKE